MLVAFISPSFFSSHECRRELERFLTRESHLDRQDLILPIYWIDTRLLEIETERRNDSLGQCIAERQYTDCRVWRFKLPSDPASVRPNIAELAGQMIKIANRPLYNIRSAVSETVKDGGMRLNNTTQEEPKGDQWLTDLADLGKAATLIDPDTKKQIMRAILTLDFRSFRGLGRAG
jgi:hypothetical protein